MEYFDQNSVLSLQEDQITQLEEKLRREKEKLGLLKEMFETNKMNERLLFGSTPCPLKKPFQHIHNVMTKEEGDIAREFFARASVDQMNAELEYTQLNVNSYLRLPGVEEKLAKIFPNMRIFGTHWFQGEKKGAEYSGWHTGINLQKCFKGNPLLITCWIPLQDLNSETGGQLWYYNGPRQVSLIDVIRHANKDTLLLQYVALQNYDKHLEEHKLTDDVKAGDCFVFREIMPHSVDGNSKGLREILSIRLIEKDAEIDEDFFTNIDRELTEGKFAFVETEGSIKTLKDFCTNVRDVFKHIKQVQDSEASSSLLQ